MVIVCDTKLNFVDKSFSKLILIYLYVCPIEICIYIFAFVVTAYMYELLIRVTFVFVLLLFYCLLAGYIMSPLTLKPAWSFLNKINNTCTEECVLAAHVPNPMGFYYKWK